VLLLVYDYMPNGSLDRHLFGGPESPILTWEQRYKIVAGVASALNYLHHEYNQRVIHRDIKPSNIMLDAAFNAQLGDFGLARALETDKTSYTDKVGVPGTLGYIAPECFHTGRATRESDVFGLGAVILEVVSGRRVSCSNQAGCSQLLEGVWQLHGAGEGRVLEAVDRRLADGEFDEGDAERLLLLGLACSHPNPGERPKARDIVQILARSAPAPDVPAAKPAFMWPVQPPALAGEDGELPTSGVSTAMTSSSTYSYYASSAGWTTQNYLLSRDHDLMDRDASTV
jgi:serine/threonine protein kinase